MGWARPLLGMGAGWVQLVSGAAGPCGVCWVDVPAAAEGEDGDASHLTCAGLAGATSPRKPSCPSASSLTLCLDPRASPLRSAQQLRCHTSDPGRLQGLRSHSMSCSRWHPTQSTFPTNRPNQTTKELDMSASGHLWQRLGNQPSAEDK